MKDNILPEEKLLKLIRGKSNNEMFPNKSLRDTAGRLKAKAGSALVIKKYLSFFDARKILIFAFIASSLYLIVSYIYPFIDLKHLKIEQAGSEKYAESKKEHPENNIKPYEFYLEGIKGRSIFVSSAVEQESMPVNALTGDLIKDINLIGIISGQNPQAIIEDKNTQKTYYLSRGQYIGEFQVKDIREGKIILNFNGQSFEINL